MMTSQASKNKAKNSKSILPSTMKAVVLTGHGGLDKLEYRTDWPVPRPGPNQVLIRVGACGMNNTDVNTRLGWYSKDVTTATDAHSQEEQVDVAVRAGDWGGSGSLSFPLIQGADVCGTVVAVGEKAPEELMGKRVIVDTWLRDWEALGNSKDQQQVAKGDDDDARPPKTTTSRTTIQATRGFFGSEANGGYAEYCVIDHRNLGVIEQRADLSDAQLATFACSYNTAEGMLSRVGVKPGDRVLITGASGGVGSALVQLANRRGAITIAMASAAKHEQMAELVKPSYLLDRAPENLGLALERATGSDKVDVVADVIAGPYFPKLIEQIARGGHYVTSGAIAGPIVQLDARTLYLNDLTFHGSTVVPPRIFRDLVSYIEKGEIRPILAATYPLQELRTAQQGFTAKKHIGNIVIVP